MATTVGTERYAAAHLAALRTAAAVLAVRARPADRRGPRNVWSLLPQVAPELAEWAAFFAAGAGKRAAAEAGLSRAVTAREADDLLRDAQTFLALVETTLGLAHQPVAAAPGRPRPAGHRLTRATARPSPVRRSLRPPARRLRLLAAPRRLAPARALVERAVEHGMDTLALTDRDGVYGAVKFARAARSAGVRPVLGVDLAVEPTGLLSPAPRWSDRRARESRRPAGAHPARGGATVDPRHPRVTLLARTAGLGGAVPAGARRPTCAASAGSR